MSNELLIGVGGLVLSVLTYFAGVWRTEKRHKDTDKRERIEKVVSKYLDLRKINSTSGLDGLQKSGVSTLLNDEEIRAAILMIMAHGEEHPLRGVGMDRFKRVNLKTYFDYAAEKGISFLSVDFKKVIDESGAQQIAPFDAHSAALRSRK